MKKNVRYLLTIVAAVLLFASCKKEERKIYFEGGTAPVLTASTAGPLVLSKSNATRPALKLNWTNPNYRFTTGVSSQDVNYTLQVAPAGANFQGPKLYEGSFARDLETVFTDSTLNGILTKMELPEDVAHDLEMRLKASLPGGSGALTSNVLKLKVTPYLDVAVPVPANGNLWIVGDATANGWDNPLKATYEPIQKFTKVSNTLYELELNMPGGGNYKLLQDNGVWGTQYHMITGGTWSSGEFEKKDADPGFPGPPSAGKYKLSFNFKTGKYTVVKI